MTTHAIVLVLGILATGIAAAQEKALTPCNAKELQTLESSIQEWSASYPHSAHLLNNAGKVVGYFSWDDTGGMHAEVCDPIFYPELTVAHEWYYWESSHDSSDPATWQVGQTHELQQDEGLAALKVLKAPADGKVTCEFTVTGWDERSDNVEVRRDVVTFVKR